MVPQIAVLGKERIGERRGIITDLRSFSGAVLPVFITGIDHRYGTGNRVMFPGRLPGFGPDPVSYTHLDVYKRQI